MAERRSLLRGSRDKSGAASGLLCLLVVVGCNGSAAPAVDNSADRLKPIPEKRQALQGIAGAADPRGVAFTDVARARGLQFTWPKQPRPMRALEAFGCGCAAFDVDNDGWQDVLLLGNPCPALFVNSGGGCFENITAGSGLEVEQGPWTGCAIGDYNGDGLLDVLLTGYRRLALYKNLGGRRFQLATAEAGLDDTNHGHWGASAGMMDLDGDGWLDLVILNYVAFGPESIQYCEQRPGVRSGCPPKSYPAERGEIWRNTGQGGFELAPDSAGMGQTTGVGLVLAFIDLDGDGRMDFYIGNDGVSADFLHNQGGMQFENIAQTAGLAVDFNSNSIASMGADWADFDRDGLLDLVVTNFQWFSFVLFQNSGDNFFIDSSAPTGLLQATRNRLGFGAKWIDFDNDGWPDLSFVNGHVYDNVAEFDRAGATLRQPISLMRNERGKKFVDLVPALGEDVQRPLLARGSATGDFDNDGRIDLLVVDYEGPVMLLENRTRTNNHWLKLDLRSAAPNVFAYGARVIGKAGDQIWVADVSPASSYLSSSDPRIHWGLGDVGSLDELVIRWPSGNEQILHDIAADQILQVREDCSPPTGK